MSKKKTMNQPVRCIVYLSTVGDNIPIWNKVMLTKEEAAAYSHIGINKLEELLKIPNCPFVLYVGKKKLIKRAEFERYLLENIEI
ncbi:MAG: excisionase [Lachnospiraceae bacterium]|nr:excisionase [Lachnospiraceae bacterium]